MLSNVSKTPPDKRDIRNTTLSWHAVSRGHVHVVQDLVATNAVDTNVDSVSQRTPVSWAAANCHIEIVELLLAHGARQDYTYEDGRPPLAIAQLHRQGIVVVYSFLDGASQEGQEDG
mgnify:CR=1 FL=1